MSGGRDWTHGEILILRRLHAANYSDRLIGDEIDRPQNSIWGKRKQLGLPAVPKAKRINKLYLSMVRVESHDAAAAMALAIRDRQREERDLTGQFFGDPQPSRSALMQAPSAMAVDRPRVSLGTMPSRDSIGRIKGGGSLTFWLRIRRARANGGGISNAIRARQSRREREARA